MSQTQQVQVFRELKAYCVPLLENSLLKPSTISQVVSLLSGLHTSLQRLQESSFVFSQSFINYVSFPLISIIQRNPPSAIPDRVLELVLLALSILCQSWWWTCEVRIWEQLFMLCGAVIGDIEGKGKGKNRDDETKEAATCCLLALTRRRKSEEAPSSHLDNKDVETVFNQFKSHSQSPKFIPILGQTINSLIITASSPHLPLQRTSLHVLHSLIAFYSPNGFVPSILPGIVSAMTRVALGASTTKGWANGDIVADSLSVMQQAIIRAIGDDICIKEGAVRDVTDLGDLVSLNCELPSQTEYTDKPYFIARTPSWLRGTSSQLLIALNTLTPLVSHPTAAALAALTTFSTDILTSTSLSFPLAQPLLLSFLLSLSSSTFRMVSSQAHESLTLLLNPPSKVRYSLLQTLVQTARDHLTALPRLLSSRSDAKVEHVAKQIEAICNLANLREGEITHDSPAVSAVSTCIAKLLGPMGGIEKWGWRLLSVLEFDALQVSIVGAPIGQLMLEGAVEKLNSVPFPEITLKLVSTRSTQISLERMFQALGKAGNEDCLFAVEWFVSVGRSRRDSNAVSALWCACQLLEGITGTTLDATESHASQRRERLRRAEKVARTIAKSIAEMWDESIDGFESSKTQIPIDETFDEVPSIDYVRGLITLDSSLRIGHISSTSSLPAGSQFLIHKCVSLQLLSITAATLQTRFTPLLLYTLYPILHSIVSPSSQLSTTAMAALTSIASNSSYASPANMLLSNFDYALDGISRRLTRQWLDIDAVKVLVVLIRLVGRDVVHKAGDVVEECFDRLDEYHGYDAVVEGLIEVLREVVKAIEEDEESHVAHEKEPITPFMPPADTGRLEEFFKWFATRNDLPEEGHDTTDYGPAPREAWGNADDKQEEEEEEKARREPDPDKEPLPTPAQALTKQIVSRSMYFLSHSSPVVRARILGLLGSAAPVLPESAFLPSIHLAWPFILNRLSDPESFVLSAAAALVESLASNFGPFMSRRIWDDIWPRFRTLLKKLDTADAQSALAKRGPAGVGTESAYTHSHRLYRSILRTMTAAVRSVQIQDTQTWEMALAFRQFLHCHAHEELQKCARELYIAIGNNNEDMVWLSLSSTMGDVTGIMSFLKQDWDIRANVVQIFQHLISMESITI